jgi:hypothetical protein
MTNEDESRLRIHWLANHQPYLGHSGAYSAYPRYLDETLFLILSKIFKK